MTAPFKLKRIGTRINEREQSREFFLWIVAPWYRLMYCINIDDFTVSHPAIGFLWSFAKYPSGFKFSFRIGISPWKPRVGPA